VRFLTGVRIRDFRSIASADVSDLGDITPIVGLNGSGKSNFMRALNLFFNGELERGVPLRLRRDFREPGRKAKLRVVVEVDLDYGAFDSLRKEIAEALESLTGSRDQITFRKEWTLDPVTHEETLEISAGPSTTDLEVVGSDLVPYATRVLNAVRFRYIPNHIHPSEILLAEQESIRKVLQDRLGQRKVLSDEDVSRIGEVATDLMRPIRDAMADATGEVADVQLATPSDWRDLAWAFGLKMQASQTQSFEALLHGSGVQSVLAFHVLHEIDTTFSGSFGWRKGAIWAIEEPESFLHASLQAEMARSLATYAEDESLQILFSTHSPAFLGTADEGLAVVLDEAGRSDFSEVERNELLWLAVATGVTPFAHPLHTGPPMPLLLVEGAGDRELIERAYAEEGFACPYEVRCLGDFDEKLSGGIDQIATWLAHNRPAIRARPPESPIFVLLDWEAADKSVAKIDNALEAHEESRCLRWPRDLTNPELSSSWVGIEKFLSSTFVEELQDMVGLKLIVPARPEDESWKFDVKRTKLKDLKPAIHDVLREREDPADIDWLIDATDWLSQQLGPEPPML
jgi:energy-coupling factor transporter ATP-binding protein EcfA2